VTRRELLCGFVRWSARRSIIISWACASILIAILIGPTNFPQLLDIVWNDATARGLVTQTDCGNHGSFKYSFDVNGRSFEGGDQASDLCERIVVGSPIMIHYSSKSPKHNIASDPLAALRNHFIVYLLTCLTFPPIAVWLLSRRSRRKPRDVQRL